MVIPRIALALLVGAAFCNATAAPDSPRDQVRGTERAFARTMAERDLPAFTRYIADDAVFFTHAAPLRGKAEVVAHWSRFFDGTIAPFSWEPDRVEVLQSGTLALSTGLVRDPGGKVIGRFNSVWRRQAPGVWRIVFDKGSPPDPGDAH